MNTEALKKLRDEIPPDRLRMYTYVSGPRPLGSGVEALLTHCDTAGCLAGWACAIFGEPGPLYAPQAAIVLGLDHNMANTLFMHNCGSCSPAQALARLDFLIANPDATADQLRSFIDESERPSKLRRGAH